MRRTSSLLLILCAAAPAAADSRVAPAGAPETEALRGTVLVWQDAPLLAEPSETAAAIRVAAFDGPRVDRAGHVIAMRVVSTRGAFVEVEPIGEPDCTWSRLTTSDDLARLKLFVRRADLAPVLAKPYAKQFSDGTRLALVPGVPVIALADGAGHVVSLRGAEVKLDIPAASVGYSYTLERAKPAVLSGTELALDPKAAATLGGQPVAIGGRRGVGVERRGETALVTLEDRCTTAAVALPGKAVREADDDETSLGFGGGGGGGAGVLGMRYEHYLPMTTALAIGGRTVALAAKPIYLPSAPAGKTVCVDRRISLDASVPAPVSPAATPVELDDKLRLCAPAAKVVHEKLRGSASANGTTKR